MLPRFLADREVDPPRAAKRSRLAADLRGEHRQRRRWVPRRLQARADDVVDADGDLRRCVLLGLSRCGHFLFSYRPDGALGATRGAAPGLHLQVWSFEPNAPCTRLLESPLFATAAGRRDGGLVLGGDPYGGWGVDSGMIEIHVAETPDRALLLVHGGDREDEGEEATRYLTVLPGARHLRRGVGAVVGAHFEYAASGGAFRPPHPFAGLHGPRGRAGGWAVALPTVGQGLHVLLAAVVRGDAAEHVADTEFGALRYRPARRPPAAAAARGPPAPAALLVACECLSGAALEDAVAAAALGAPAPHVPTFAAPPPPGGVVRRHDIIDVGSAVLGATREGFLALVALRLPFRFVSMVVHAALPAGGPQRARGGAPCALALSCVAWLGSAAVHPTQPLLGAEYAHAMAHGLVTTVAPPRAPPAGTAVCCSNSSTLAEGARSARFLVAPLVPAVLLGWNVPRLAADEADSS